MNNEKRVALIAKRKDCNLKQREVANSANISTRHYQNIEAGESKANVEAGIFIAETLGIDKVEDMKKLFVPPIQEQF